LVRGPGVLKRMQQHARHVIDLVCAVVYGMTLYPWAREIDRARGEQERLFVLVVYGDLLGIPVLPPYYTLRLLPFVVPELSTWRHSILRERDLTDLFDQDIG
jgi:ABC-type amino acid transport system permease subunit